MNKKEEDKLINAIIALHKEIKGLRQDMDKQLAKVNLGLNELRLSYVKLDESFKKLDESFNKYADSNNYLVNNHETRIIRLEEKNSSGSFVAESKTEYKKRNVQMKKKK